MVNLSVGDTFGLLVDKFWFCIQACDENSELQMNGSTIKRRTSSSSEPDSTTKKVKTEPDEFQTNGGGGGGEALNDDATLVLLNGDANGMATNTFDANVTNNQVPSTSSSSANDPTDNQNAMCPLHGQIKTEPIDLDENEAQPMQTTDAVAIKIEPDLEHNCIHCSSNVPVKSEIKEEPANNGDGIPTSSNEVPAPSNDQSVASSNDQPVEQQAERSTRRECCRHGVRCYRWNLNQMNLLLRFYQLFFVLYFFRRNPAHRAEEAHPGDTDYRLPDYPDPPLGAPQCPFLDRCYRRNPIHFQQFSHKTNC